MASTKRHATACIDFRYAVLMSGFIAVLVASGSCLAEETAADPPATPFTPADISIGEPIALPVTPPTAMAPVRPADPAVAPRPAASVPGSGWLGVTVAESNVPGRWQIDDVVAGGPAARAGILVGDELRAVNGLTLKSLEEASQAVTSIAAGQEVKIAVARADRLSDLVLIAEPRPAAAAPPRGWRANDAASVPVAVSPPPIPQPLAAPSVIVQPPSPEVLPPAASPFAAAPQQFAPSVPQPAAPPTPGPSSFVPAGPTGPPQPLETADRGPQGRGRTALGVRTLPIDPGIQARFNLPEASGAYVIGVVQDLPASKAGVPPGSVIVALDNRPVRSPVELTQLVTSGPIDRPVTLQFVLPGGESKKAEVKLQALEVPLERVLVGDAAASPAPTPAPALRSAQRPSTADATLPLVEQIKILRARLERLERRLQAVSPLR
jgi:membrane-associated protease RseP (regulator of RpoE activity)